MTRLTSFTAVIIAVSVCYATVTVMAEETQPAPTEQAQPQPQMPEGHPPLPQDHPELPEGHPEMPQGRPVMPQGHPPITEQPTEPKVYETTEVEPDWFVAMRHLIIRPMENQLHITEVWAVVNPTDKSYIGAPVEEANEVATEGVQESVATPEDQAEQAQPEASHDKVRTTISLPLPAMASHVQPGRGFETCCVRIEEGKLISTLPMTPGTNELHINYLLAAENGVFELPLTSLAPTNHIMVLLPDDGSEVTATGLAVGDPFTAGDKQFRVFMAKQIEKGAELGLTIKAIQPSVTSASTQPVGSAATTDNIGQIKMIAGIGGGILLLAAVIVLLKPSKKQPTTGTAG